MIKLKLAKDGLKYGLANVQHVYGQTARKSASSVQSAGHPIEFNSVKLRAEKFLICSWFWQAKTQMGEILTLLDATIGKSNRFASFSQLATGRKSQCLWPTLYLSIKRNGYNINIYIIYTLHIFFSRNNWKYRPCAVDVVQLEISIQVGKVNVNMGASVYKHLRKWILLFSYASDPIHTGCSPHLTPLQLSRWIPSQNNGPEGISDWHSCYFSFGK